MLQSELDGKRVVVALGGNALGDAPGEQLKLLEGASKNLARMVKEGINVVVTHGNGPQVGIIDEAFEVASKDKDAQVPPMPLSDCNAMSQGYIGAQLSCALRNEFHRQDIMREVANVPTHVVVDADDPAFKDYEKPAFMTESEARAFAKATGYQVREDSGRGWRRVVPSPVPQDIVELETVRDLMEDGCVVIAAGGGGIPVTVRDGVHTAVDAIVDKDLDPRLARAGRHPRHPDGGGEGLPRFREADAEGPRRHDRLRGPRLHGAGTVRARLHAAEGAGLREVRRGAPGRPRRHHLARPRRRRPARRNRDPHRIRREVAPGAA